MGERHYPKRLPLFKPIWDHLYEGIQNGEIISVDAVKDELEQKADDWRSEFLQASEVMFKITDTIEQRYGMLIAHIEGDDRFSINASRSRFFKGADPWVIALAQETGCAIVSAETKNLSAYGIGAICDALKIPHMNLVDFIEKNKIGH